MTFTSASIPTTRDASGGPGPVKTQPGDWAAPWAFDDPGRLVGRAADLDRIGAFIAGIPRAGGPLLLMGEPGVGKTALLAAARSQAEASGMYVLPAAGVEYGRDSATAGCSSSWAWRLNISRPSSREAPWPWPWGTTTARPPNTRRSPMPCCRWSGGFRAASPRCWP